MSLDNRTPGGDNAPLNASELFENLTASGVDESVAAAALTRLLETLPPERLAGLILFGMLEQADAAHALGFEESTLRNWISRREVPFVRLGKRNVVLVASMREWLQKKETKPYGSH